jgi:hypothetical protein
MKEVRLKFKDLSQDRRDAIIILKDWLFHLYKEKGFTRYWPIYNWLSKVINHHSLISASDLLTLRELWNTYAEYKLMGKEDA